MQKKLAFVAYTTFCNTSYKICRPIIIPKRTGVNPTTAFANLYGLFPSTERVGGFAHKYAQIGVCKINVVTAVTVTY
jgi:hypothetical protein